MQLSLILKYAIFNMCSFLEAEDIGSFPNMVKAGKPQFEIFHANNIKLTKSSNK